MNDEYIGKKAYKKNGFYGGLIGVIQKSDHITPYKIVFGGGGAVGIRKEDIMLVEEGDNE